MSGIACGIVGACAASIGWFFVLAWIMDRHDAERKAWHQVVRFRVVDDQ
jgi:arginine exporter protein ArgO